MQRRLCEDGAVKVLLWITVLLCTAQGQSIQLTGFEWPKANDSSRSTSPNFRPEDSTTVQFLNESELFVTYPVLNKKPGLSDRKNLTGGVYVVNAITVNLSAGTQSVETLGNLSSFREVRRLSNGLLFRRDFYEIYFRNSEGIDHQLSAHASEAIVSPLGQLVALDERTRENPRSAVTFYSLSTFQKAGELEVLPSYWQFDYLGDRIAFAMHANENNGFTVRIKEPGGEHEFKRPVGCNMPHFLEGERLLFIGCGELVVTDLSGNVLQSKKFGTKQSLGRLTRSAAGRVGGIIQAWRGGSEFLDINPHIAKAWIVVWQDATLAEVMRVEVPVNGPTAFALSPSGTHLAYIDVKGVLRVVDVPPIAKR